MNSISIREAKGKGKKEHRGDQIGSYLSFRAAGRVGLVNSPVTLHNK